MEKVRQNVVLLMDPTDDAWDISLKAGNMYLNRFCIDEDAAFESTGVYYLKRSAFAMRQNYHVLESDFESNFESDFERKAKGQRKFSTAHLSDV